MYVCMYVCMCIYWSIVICFPRCVRVLQNEYVSIAKSVKYDYWFSESLGRWSVGRWSLDLLKPWSSNFACARWSRFILLFLCILGEIYFVNLILIFSILPIKNLWPKQICSPETVTKIFNYLSIITSNRTNQEPTAASSNILFYY